MEKNVGEFAGLLGRACPAGVYEYVDQEGGEGEKRVEDEGWAGKKLVINSQVSLAMILGRLYSRGGASYRIASTASYATSKYPLKTLRGLFPRGAGVQSTVSELRL